MNRIISSLLFLLALSACDSGTTNTTPLPPPTQNDPVVAGVNLDTLFASPTGAERSAVRSEWAGRSSNYTFDLVQSTIGSDGAELNVFSARRIATTDILFYGLVRRPIRMSGDVALRPLVLVLPDNDQGTSDFALRPGSIPIQTDVHEDYVFATIAYRGEQLRAGSLEFDSEANSSAYNFDTDDALAFVEHVQNTELLVNPNRTGVIGFGRGGTVALLTQSRNHPFNLIIDIAGPTDFIGTAFRSKARSILLGNSGGDFPAISDIAAEILLPLRDGSLSMQDARHALLLISPKHFVSPPPFILVAHGDVDFDVPVEHSRALETISGTPDALYLELENTDHLNILSDVELISTATNIFQTHLGGP